MTEKLIRIAAVAEMIGATPDGVRKWVKEGKFPAPVKVGPNFIAWPESVVQKWISDKVKGL
jgi:prophage regulatory protein